MYLFLGISCSSVWDHQAMAGMGANFISILCRKSWPKTYNIAKIAKLSFLKDVCSLLWMYCLSCFVLACLYILNLNLMNVLTQPWSNLRIWQIVKCITYLDLIQVIKFNHNIHWPQCVGSCQSKHIYIYIYCYQFPKSMLVLEDFSGNFIFFNIGGM